MPRKAKITPIQPPVTPIVPPLPPAPEPPNPVVLALQEQILGLVNERSACMQDLANAKAAHVRAQESIAAVEGEVRYRMGLINELLGKPAAQYAHISEVAHYQNPAENMAFLTGAPSSGVGSIPPRRAPMAGVNDGVRTESAEAIRSAI